MAASCSTADGEECLLEEAAPAATATQLLSAVDAVLKKQGFNDAKQLLQRVAGRDRNAGPLVLDALLEVTAETERGATMQQQVALLADFQPRHVMDRCASSPGIEGGAAYSEGEREGEGEGEVGGDAMLLSRLSEVVRELAVRQELKVLVRVLKGWQISDLAVLGTGTTQQVAAATLAAARTGATPAAAAVLTAFPQGLFAEIDAQEVLNAVESAGHEDLATRAAKGLSQQIQHVLVGRRLQEQRYRAAARAVHELGLEAAFPGVDLLWRRLALVGSFSHGRREAAVGVSFEEPDLREACVKGLASLGGYVFDGKDAEHQYTEAALELSSLEKASNLALAVELAASWQVPLPAAVAEKSTGARQLLEETSLALPSSFEVQFIACDADVRAMEACLSQAPVVGFDAEFGCWQGAPISLLQLSSSDRAFLVDVISLRGSDMLAKALEGLFACMSCIKVGMSVAADLSKLAGCLPGLRSSGSFSTRNSSIVDLLDREATRRASECRTSHKRARDGISLSGLSEKYLGKALDKTVQMSDWSQRPLSRAQTRYAAMDAWAPVMVLAEMQRQGH